MRRQGAHHPANVRFATTLEFLSYFVFQNIIILMYSIIAEMDYAGQVGVGHFYHIFYDGCLTNFEIEEGQEEASKLYPEVKYTRMDDYLKQYL